MVLEFTAYIAIYTVCVFGLLYIIYVYIYTVLYVQHTYHVAHWLQ